ncbi:MAG: glycosyltransferase family 2 protein [Lachnospiraceae bacterium]|nr:glycosyltransferase family 2 protein [Lachnospiraceae bacterium]
MPNTHDTISIVVPVYKVEGLLDRCVRSILGQTVPDWELILVDDGSPDSCGALCDAWAEKDSRIFVIHQVNGGLSAARNSGIARASGEWLAFLDSDDWWAESFLEEMLAAAQQQEADLSICGWTLEYEDGRTPEDRLPEPGVFTSREALMTLSGPDGVLYVTAWNRLIRRSLWGDLQFPPGKLHEDEFTAHLLLDRTEKTAVLARPLVHYWQRSGSITAVSGNLKHWDGTEAIAERYRYFQEKGYAELLAPTFRKFLYHYFLCLRDLDTDSPEGRERLAAVRRLAEPLLKERNNLKNCTAGERLGLARPALWKKIHRLRHAAR